MTNDPHTGQPLLHAGRPLDQAAAVMVLVHGRGANARSILSLADEFGRDDFAYLAPQAAMNTWYPQRFLVPLEANEPWLSSALAAVDRAVQTAEEAGVAAGKIVLAGFSQGACLAAEYVARNPRRYGGLVVYSGGLIGPEGQQYPYSGSLEGTPVFLGCGDVDFHIPVERVHQSAAVFRQLSADVTARIYAGMDHTINEDELDFTRSLMASLV